MDVESGKDEFVTAKKSLSFRYVGNGDLASLFDDFRLMCNDAIRIALQTKPKSRFGLIGFAYQRLKDYGLHSHYIHSACEVAFSLYKNKSRKSVPLVRKAFIKLDNESYLLNHLLLRIPSTPRRYIFLTLQGSAYHSSLVDDDGLRRGSVTITPNAVIISFSKRVKEMQPLGYLGIDINERNVAISATNGCHRLFGELAKVAAIKERYKMVRAKIGRVTSRDRRIARQLLAKYGARERNRTSPEIHKITKSVVSSASRYQLGIKLEKLTGIRRLYRKRSRQGPLFRGRMNSWVFGETQRQIEYKAAWLGVPVYHINPRGTSRNCPVCGSRVVPLLGRKLYCPKCDKTWDRDDLASKNIMAAVVPAVRPLRRSDEGERGDDGSNPRADGRKLIQGG